MTSDKRDDTCNALLGELGPDADDALIGVGQAVLAETLG
jgi:hypothetical protein